jgi:hypothetical protein
VVSVTNFTTKLPGLPSPEAPMTEWARFYRFQLGWNTLPLRPDTKRPALNTWKPLQHELIGEEEIGNWWGRYPQLGIAVVCGRISRLVVLDVDPRNGGEATFARIAAVLPPCPVVRTPSGGLHLYFALPEGCRVHSTTLGPGLELKAEGSYVVAPPTKLGERGCYTWVNRSPCPSYPAN